MSLQGHLLIAARELTDPNFSRSVVLLVRHSEEGALGLILNRPSRATVKEVWKKISQSECRIEGPLCVGGPCEGPLMVLHTHKSLWQDEVIPGLYFTTEQEELVRLATEDDIVVRLFFGYAGWSAGQLESELEGGGWYTLPAKLEHVVEADDQLWERLLKDATTSMLATTLRIKHIPSDPSMN